jgi:hypothetical protein
MVGDCLILIATVHQQDLLDQLPRTLESSPQFSSRGAGLTSISRPGISVQSLAIFTKMCSVVSIPYNALLSFVLFCLAMAILCLYYYNLAKWYVTHNRRKTAYLTSRPKWHLRFQCWSALFILAILGLTLEYFCELLVEF